MTTANNLMDLARTRLRGQSHTPDDLRVLADYAQKAVVLGTRAVVVEEAFQTYANQQLYSVTELVPSLGIMVALRDGDRDILEYNWRQLAFTDRAWVRKVGPRQEVYAMIGRDLLVIHPALAEDRELTIHYVKHAGTLTADEVVLDEPDELLPATADLLEALCLLRDRRFAEVQGALKRFLVSLKEASRG